MVGTGFRAVVDESATSKPSTSWPSSFDDGVSLPVGSAAAASTRRPNRHPATRSERDDESDRHGEALHRSDPASHHHVVGPPNSGQIATATAMPAASAGPNGNPGPRRQRRCHSSPKTAPSNRDTSRPVMATDGIDRAGDEPEDGGQLGVAKAGGTATSCDVLDEQRSTRDRRADDGSAQHRRPEPRSDDQHERQHCDRSCGKHPVGDAQRAEVAVSGDGTDDPERHQQPGSRSPPVDGRERRSSDRADRDRGHADGNRSKPRRRRSGRDGLRSRRAHHPHSRRRLRVDRLEPVPSVQAHSAGIARVDPQRQRAASGVRQTVQVPEQVVAVAATVVVGRHVRDNEDIAMPTPAPPCIDPLPRRSARHNRSANDDR